MFIQDMVTLADKVVGIDGRGVLYLYEDCEWHRLLTIVKEPEPVKPEPSQCKKSEFLYETAVMNEEMSIAARDPTVKRQHLVVSQCYGILAAMAEQEEETVKLQKKRWQT